MKAMFGPAGNSDDFTKVHKSSVMAPLWLREMGLDCYEYQCGRGVNIGAQTAGAIGRAAFEHGIAMSLHSPYFINLSSGESERVQKNLDYIESACRAADWMGADRVVVHCGGLGGLERDAAMENSVSCLEAALKRLDAAMLGHITLCVETMGKVNTIGSLEDVCAICASSDRLLPCVDFGHLNSRSGGGLKTAEDFDAVLDYMESSLGRARAQSFHAHFSKIQYSKGGEVRHLTFDDQVYGPDFHLMLGSVVKKGFTPRIICESAGTQAKDALQMKLFYESALPSGE